MFLLLIQLEMDDYRCVFAEMFKIGINENEWGILICF